MSRSLGFALVCCALSSALASGSYGQEALPRPNEAEAKIEAALGEPARLHFADQPLADVVEQLAKRHKIAIQIDNKTLAQVGLGSNTPVTAHVEGVTLRSALRLMLAQRALTYAIRDEALVITTQSEAESMLTVAFYPVGDLVATDNGFRPPPAPGQVAHEDYQQLIELITCCVGATTWDEIGGPGAIHAYPRSHALAITQTAEIHHEIAELLAALRQAAHKQRLAAKLLQKMAQKPQSADVEAIKARVYRLTPQPATQTAVPDQPSPPLAVPGPQAEWPQEAEPRPNANEAAIEKALDARLDLSFTDAPLSEVVEFIKQKTQLDVQVDSRALAIANLGLDARVTRRLAGLSLRAALRRFLGELDLTYVIRDESLLITSKACGQNMLSCKVYPVFDLVVRPSNAPQRGSAVDWTSLVEGLTTNIAPTSWDEVGGPGSITQSANAGAMVISQTTEIHEEIARYLRALREVGAEE